MADEKQKILVLVEGEKTDVRLMKALLRVYEIDAKYEIISYNTNIYALYDEMFKDEDPADMDLLQTLKSREYDAERKALFDERYTDILLIFDLDPQDSRFSEEHLQEMMRFFHESSDMGKLYLNYPMVEAFYHMSSIPDPAYNERIATLDELREGAYKKRVNRESRSGDYRKFATTRFDWTCVIRQNIEKALFLQCATDTAPNTLILLQRELDELRNKQRVFVLCTCIFYILDYNSALLDS